MAKIDHFGAYSGNLSAAGLGMSAMIVPWKCPKDGCPGHIYRRGTKTNGQRVSRAGR
jgi:hypothetical protein